MRAQIKNEVGELIVEEILTFVGSGNSPVSGQGKFKRLTKDYANNEKGGSRLPNLELEGDMLDSLKVINRKGGDIEIGIFKSSQAGKADGHNNHSGDSKLPLRRFIPTESETFKQQIISRVKDLIKINTPSDTTPEREEQETQIFRTFQPTPLVAEINLDALVGDIFADIFGPSNG